MRPLRTSRILKLAGALAVAADPIGTSAAIGDTTADVVVGQPSFSTSTPSAGRAGLAGPFAAAFDASGNLFVADYQNNRVLGYRSPLTTDSLADLVIGQPNFSANVPNSGGVSASSLNSPAGVAVDAAGNLYVADTGNNRVLVYDRPFATDRIADHVFGQPDFASSAADNGGVSARSLDYPTGVALDRAGNLAVADWSNSRVLLLQTPAPLVASVELKVSPTTGTLRLVVRGLGMEAESAVVEVDGDPLSVTRYKQIAADGSAGCLVAKDDRLDSMVRPDQTVQITVFNPRTGSRSDPVPFTR